MKRKNCLDEGHVINKGKKEGFRKRGNSHIRRKNTRPVIMDEQGHKEEEEEAGQGQIRKDNQVLTKEEEKRNQVQKNEAKAQSDPEDR